MSKKKRNPLAAVLRLFKPKRTKNKKKYTRKDKHKGAALSCLLILLLAGCSSTPITQVITEYKMPEVIHPANPQQLNLLDFEVLVVNEKILDQMAESADSNTSYMLVSPEGYTTIIKNFNELKRYILNQKAIIVYYKKILKKDTEDATEK